LGQFETRQRQCTACTSVSFNNHNDAVLAKAEQLAACHPCYTYSHVRQLFTPPGMMLPHARSTTRLPHCSCREGVHESQSAETTVKQHLSEQQQQQQQQAPDPLKRILDPLNTEILSIALPVSAAVC
jgi:hypothetical protein